MANTFDPYQVLVKLPPESQRLLLNILARNDPMDPSTSRKVKDVCSRVSKELEQMGLLADYYAYALIYWASQQNPEALTHLVDQLSAPRARDLFGPNSLN